MSEESPKITREETMDEAPIERGFPIEQVNDIAKREGHAKMYYRPVYTMHKWWARRLGSVFRTISLYTLLDDANSVNVFEPGEDQSLSSFSSGQIDIQTLIDNVSLEDPESLWELYAKDVRVDNKRILDPFMGGGTSLVEASRFGAEVVGNDLNPVSWFVVKKELEAGTTDVDEVVDAYDNIRDSIADDLRGYYKTNCPNGDHDAESMYAFWIKELDCVSCGTVVPLYNDYRIGKARYEDGKYDVYCPHCHSITRVDDWRSECVCEHCGTEYVPEDGNVSRGKYSCPDCGQKYSIVDRIQERGDFDSRLYAVEYFCQQCKEDGRDKSEVKGYKAADDRDFRLFEEAEAKWEQSENLHRYVPDTEIPLGIMTDSTAFEGSIGGGHNLLRHGYTEWTDMFNERQLLCLSKLLKSILEIEDQNVREYLILTFSDCLKTNTLMASYSYTGGKISDIFSTNSFDTPQEPLETNVWGAPQGAGTFSSMFNMVKKGIEFSANPVERYVKDGSTVKTKPFSMPIGSDFSITQGDARSLEFDEKFDAVITDPPYYDNVIYSEISNFFYSWLRVALKDQYTAFEPESTPRAESIVANPAENKGAEEFESELKESFDSIKHNLKEDGVLVFTYHHSNSESWGELLAAICDVGFRITATYPISADLSKHPTKIAKGDSVSFDIIIVARPVDETESVSWNSLRRDIYRTAKETRRRLETSDQELSRGDIGVVEMGECFREYSQYHDKVQRDGEIMSAKEVVNEIYGIIQDASDIGVIDVYLDLLDTPNPGYDDVNKLCRGTNATPEDLQAMKLYNREDGFTLGTWNDEKRQAYIQERVNGDNDSHLTALDKLQFLRYRYEKGQSVQNYIEKWGVDDDLRELAGRVADVTSDDTYTRVLGDRDVTNY